MGGAGRGLGRGRDRAGFGEGVGSGGKMRGRVARCFFIHIYAFS